MPPPGPPPSRPPRCTPPARSRGSACAAATAPPSTSRGDQVVGVDRPRKFRGRPRPITRCPRGAARRGRGRRAARSPRHVHRPSDRWDTSSAPDARAHGSRAGRQSPRAARPEPPSRHLLVDRPSVLRLPLTGQEANLASAESELKTAGGTVLAVRTDVSKRIDLELLARQTLDAFGQVHLLFNNAGVGAGGAPWDATWNDWEWVIGVNLWGVINGVKVFTPLMLAQNTACHIVNTSSIAGLSVRGPWVLTR